MQLNHDGWFHYRFYSFSFLWSILSSCTCYFFLCIFSWFVTLLFLFFPIIFVELLFLARYQLWNLLLPASVSTIAFFPKFKSGKRRELLFASCSFSHLETEENSSLTLVYRGNCIQFLFSRSVWVSLLITIEREGKIRRSSVFETEKKIFCSFSPCDLRSHLLNSLTEKKQSSLH